MMGQGRQIPGGDADQAALFSREGIEAESASYSAPTHLNDLFDLDRHVTRLDRRDGRVDGTWLGRTIEDPRDTPAYVDYQNEIVLRVLEHEGYGDDDVPDLFFVNYKTADTIGHHFTMDSPQMKAVLEAEDAALETLTEWLDENAGDYALIVTADHGHTPSAARSGAWAISNSELVSDLNRHFDVEEGESITEGSVGVGLFLDAAEMEEAGASTGAVVDFLNAYTIGQNWADESLPEGFENRGGEQVFDAVFAGEDLPDIMRCAFGSAKPPPGARG